MNVLLIYPDTDPLSIVPRRLINIEPLGLEYLAGELEDHNVTILDIKTDKRWRKVIENSKPDVVGITGTVVHRSRMIEILDFVKRLHPEAVTVVGGPHATLVPDDFFVPEVDVLIAGQSPEVFRQLVESLELDSSLEEVNGLLLKSHRGWFPTGAVPSSDSLDHLPMPRRELTAKYRHKYQHIFWKPVALMVTSVGCPHSCNFCPCPVLTGRRVLKRSPELVLRELQDITEPYVYIGDDNLFFDYKHAMRIADLVRSAGLKKQFYALSRVDSIVNHPDLVERWAEIGLKKIFLGLESPDDDEIRALNKKGTVAENNRAIEILHVNDVDTLGAFIINPDYTRADFDRVLEYMDRMKIYYFEFTILTPFPGTEFYDMVRNDITSEDTRLFDLAHSVFPTKMPQDRFYREFSRLHRRAASPLRALKIKPTVSPFDNFAYLRQLPQLADLFVSARRAYRGLRRLDESRTEGIAAGR